jgi:hypothetical protein
MFGMSNHISICLTLTGGVFPRQLPWGYPMSALPPQLPPRRHLSAEQRWALEILAAAGLRGCTGTTLLTRGFNVGMLANLVRDGLATARRETMRMGKRKIKVARVRITDAGQRALEG